MVMTLAHTTAFALHLDRLPVSFVKTDTDSHFCVTLWGDGVNVSYPVSIHQHPNSSNRFFGVSYDE